MSNDSAKVSILFLGSSPKSRAPLELTREFNELSRELEAGLPGCFELRSRWGEPAKRLPDLLDEYEPQVLHFSGHGTQGGRLLFEAQGDEYAPGPDIVAKVFAKSTGSVRCVVLNACYSEDQAQLIARHVDVVIGVSDRITDTAALELTKALYKAVGEGHSVGKAFEDAQLKLELGGDMNTLVLCHGPNVDPSTIYLRQEASWWRVLGWLTALAVVLVVLVATLRDTGPCGEMARQLDGVWDEEREDQVDTQAPRFESPRGKDPSEHISGSLNRWRPLWIAEREALCESPPRSEEYRDAFEGCLTRQLDRVRGVVNRLIDTQDADMFSAALLTLNTIVRRDPSECSNWVKHGVASPPESIAGDVARLRAELDHANELRASAHLQEALDLSKSIEDEAGRLGYEPLTARAAAGHAKAKFQFGEFDRAADLYTTAIHRATKNRLEGLAADLSLELAILHFHHLKQPEQGSRYLEDAELSYQTVGEDSEAQGRLAYARAARAKASHDYGEANKMLEIALFTIGGTNVQYRIVYLRERALVLDLQKKEEEALALRRRMIGEAADEYGCGHPHMAVLYLEHGNALNKADQNGAEYLRLAQKIQGERGDTHQWSHHAKVTFLENDIAILLGAEPPDFESLKEHVRALGMLLEGSLPTEHPDLAIVPRLRATIAGMENDPESALIHTDKALAILSASGEGESSEAFEMRLQIAEANMKLGDLEKASKRFHGLLENEQTPPLLQQKVHLGLCELALRENDLKMADAELISITSVDDSCACIYHVLRPLVYLRQGSDDLAQEAALAIPTQCLLQIQTGIFDIWFGELSINDNERAKLMISQ